ncbi:AcrR family transcriptional regulator [Yoonia maritima]|uniref:AcrR family transcriptional regulator n=1 Tax=Yoonia maritima TaxID=1435347 RepID=A0A2T0VZH7_9RHOB|nr:TetR/AcrR family transcriptional regulator [Yoonia maritima]PRY77745.1 AcrR family transcriptional regulator [Yoonia maritima]
MSEQSNRAKSQQQTRDALLQAGAQLIAQNGYAGASVRDIAAQAGFTQGAFYSNFKNKDELVFAIMRRLFQHAYDSISYFSKDTTTPTDEMLAEASVWLQDMCGSDEKAQLEAEISLHAMRDMKFADSYFALLDEHAAKMTDIVSEIARARKMTLCAPADQIARGMIAMARGLKLMMPRHDPKTVIETLGVFLDATMRSCQKSRNDQSDL